MLSLFLKFSAPRVVLYLFRMFLPHFVEALNVGFRWLIVVNVKPEEFALEPSLSAKFFRPRDFEICSPFCRRSL